MLFEVPRISSELADFLESGVSVVVATRDASLRPDCMRGMGIRVEAGGDELTVFLPRGPAARAIANLRDNGQIAVTFARPSDYRSHQVKGRMIELRDAVESERSLQERYHAAFSEQLSMVGIVRSVSRRLSVWPSVAVLLAVDEQFVQTPGPGAGRKT